MNWCITFVAALLISLPAEAQLISATRRDFETRSELEARAQQAEGAGRASEAAIIRSRLQRGDFQSGDRIVIAIEGGAATFADTVLVGTLKQVSLPQLGDVSLDGALRSELVPRLQKHVSTFLRDAVVKANPLVRIAILGSVGKPGFYYVPAEIALSDVLMGAGGPTVDADLEKMEIRRAGAKILDNKATRTAVTQGMSIDMLNLRAGDEIIVGKGKGGINLGVALSAATTVVGLLFTIRTLSR